MWVLEGREKAKSGRRRIVHFHGPLPNRDKGLGDLFLGRKRGWGKVVKSGVRIFPCVYACSRVLKLAIGTHEVL